MRFFGLRLLVQTFRFGTFMRLYFYPPGLLCARGEKDFFPIFFFIKIFKFSKKNFFPKKVFLQKKIFFFQNSLKKSFLFQITLEKKNKFFYNFSCKTCHSLNLSAYCIPFNKNRKIDLSRIKKSSLNTVLFHRAVIEGSPPTCHFTSFLRGLRSRRNSGETQQLDHSQGLSQSSEVNNR